MPWANLFRKFSSAEAFAEWLHREVRKEWGFGQNEQFTNQERIQEKYRGIRPAPGYPACLDHTEKQHLFELLQVEKTIGITLTESYAMYPTASVSGSTSPILKPNIFR